MHCEEEVTGKALLCSFCSSLLEAPSKKKVGCLVALEGQGPALSLLRHSALDEVAKSMAAFMAVALQKEQLFPDVIYPSKEGNKALIKYLSEFLSIPIAKKGKKILIADTHPREEERLKKEGLYLFFCEK